MLLPPRSPYCPACRGLLRIIGNSRSSKAVIAIIGYGVGRWILIQVNDVDVDCRLAGAAAPGHRNRNCHMLWSIRRCPAYPCQLAVAIGIVDVADLVAPAVHIKGCRYRMIRIALTAADGNRCDDLCIYPVFVVLHENLRRFVRLILKPNDTKNKGAFDFRI